MADNTAPLSCVGSIWWATSIIETTSNSPPGIPSSTQRCWNSTGIALFISLKALFAVVIAFFEASNPIPFLILFSCTNKLINIPDPQPISSIVESWGTISINSWKGQMKDLPIDKTSNRILAKHVEKSRGWNGVTS